MKKVSSPLCLDKLPKSVKPYKWFGTHHTLGEVYSFTYGNHVYRKVKVSSRPHIKFQWWDANLCKDLGKIEGNDYLEERLGW